MQFREKRIEGYMPELEPALCSEAALHHIFLKCSFWFVFFFPLIWKCPWNIKIFTWSHFAHTSLVVFWQLCRWCLLYQHLSCFLNPLKPTEFFHNFLPLTTASQRHHKEHSPRWLPWRRCFLYPSRRPSEEWLLQSEQVSQRRQSDRALLLLR